MASHCISASALVPAPAPQVYHIIANYHDGHPRILPKPPFTHLVVEEGGIGAGTVIRVHLRALGRPQTFRAVVTEPEPGRVLVESNDNGYVTTFTVEPRHAGQHAFVTISSETTVRDGVLGTLQAWLATRLLHPVLVRELAQLAAIAAQVT